MGKKHMNTTDPDSVKAKGDRGTRMYHKVQIATDGKHGIIVNADAVSQVNDINQPVNKLI